MCVECGVSVDYLCEQISPSVLKLAQCEACGGVIDKFIEYDGVLLSLDMLLLKTNAYRHIAFNHKKVGPDKALYTKYSNGTSAPTPAPSGHSYTFGRRVAVLFLASLVSDTYVMWLHTKDTGGKVTLNVMESNFLYKFIEALCGTLLYYLCIISCSVSLFKLPKTDDLRLDIRLLAEGLVVGSFGKLFAMTSAIWSQDIRLLRLSYVLVLMNNIQVLRVVSGRGLVAPVCVVLGAWCVERYAAMLFTGSLWPWDLDVFNGTYKPNTILNLVGA